MADLSADEIIAALADDMMADGDLGEALRATPRARLAIARPGSGRSCGPGRAARAPAGSARRAARSLSPGRCPRLTSGPSSSQIVQAERDGIDRRLADTAGGKDGPGEAATPELDDLLRDTIARRLARARRLAGGPGRPDSVARGVRLPRPGGARASSRRWSNACADRSSIGTPAGMADAVRGMSPEDLAANRAMVRDLDQLLQQQLAGAEPDPAEFLARHGAFFPGAKTVEDIIEQLAERMSAMQSLLRSLSPEQRSELNSLVDGLLRDDRLRWDLAQLSATLDQLLPDGLGERFRFGGDGRARPRGCPGPARDARPAGGARRPARRHRRTGRPRPDRSSRAGASCSTRTRCATSTPSIGWPPGSRRPATSTGDADHLELTPRGSRRIGQKVLDDLFARLAARRVRRAPRSTAPAGAVSGPRGPSRSSSAIPSISTCAKPSPMPCTRPENAPPAFEPERVGPRPIQLAATDFAVHRTEEIDPRPRRSCSST